MLWVRLLAKRAVRRKSYAGGLQMNPRSKCIAAVVLLFAFLLVAQAPPVCAQTAATGQIVGTVTDQLASASDGKPAAAERSEEHTSELQSHSDLVCRLLLEKKKMWESHVSPSGAVLGGGQGRE